MKTQYKHIHFVPEVCFGDETSNWCCKENDGQHATIGMVLDHGNPTFERFDIARLSEQDWADIRDFMEQLRRK